MTVWSTEEDWLPEPGVDESRGPMQLTHDPATLELLETSPDLVAIGQGSLYRVDADAMTATSVTNQGYNLANFDPDRRYYIPNQSSGPLEVFDPDNTVRNTVSIAGPAIGVWGRDVVVAENVDTSTVEVCRLDRDDYSTRKWETNNTNRSWQNAYFCASADDSNVYFGFTSNHVVAFDKDNGSQQWAYSTADSPIAIGSDGSRVFIGDENGDLSAVSASSGSEYWSQTLGGFGQPAAATDGSGVYTTWFGDSSNQGFAGKKDGSGNVVWEETDYPAGDGYAAGVGPNYAYIAEGGTIHKHDKDDGTDLGSVDTGANQIFSISAAPGGYGLFGGMW